MLVVQKHWKPFWTRGTTKIVKYYKTVTALDEAFGLFLLKHYAEIQSFSKKLGGKNKQPNMNNGKSGRRHFLVKIEMPCWITTSGTSSFNLHKTIDLDGSILAQDIEEHCHQEIENKNKDKQEETTYFLHTDTLRLALTALPMG